MSNPVTYSPQALTNALNKGYFYIGTNDVGKGPTSSTGYFDGVTPSNNQYVIYYYKDGSTKIYYCSNGDQVYVITNRLKSQNFTTLESALNYIATQGDMLCVNREYEPIVTNGLVLNLDAGFVPSYPMTGSTWYDLSDNDNDGTLTNGPTFNSANGGSIVFDGTDDEVNIPILSIFNTPSVTYEVWANLQNRNNRHILYVNWGGNSLEANSNRSVVFYNLSSAGQQGAVTSLSVFEWDTWVHFAGTYDDDSKTLKTYVNGVLLATRLNIPSTNYGVSTHKISGTNFGNGGIKGNVQIVRHYNRALTSSEILQNYNAQKGRFGL
jgi:hypothetical protein